MVLLVFEGPDGAGKTTALNHIAEELERRDGRRGRKVIIRHHSQLKRDPLEEYERDYEPYVPGGDHLLVDRLHWGELVYGPMFRGESKLTVAGMRHIDMFLDKRGASMVYFEPSVQLLQERLAMRGDDFVRPDQLGAIRDGYKKVARASSMTNVHTYVKPLSTAEYASLLIEGDLNEMRAMELSRFTTYVGAQYPDKLLLGDVRNDPSWESAFVPTNASSGRFLLDCLKPQEMSGLGLANACDVDPVYRLWQTLGSPKVVALGKNAYEKAGTEGIPCVMAYHPQYVRRFYNKQSARYSNIIRQGFEGREHTTWQQA